MTAQLSVHAQNHDLICDKKKCILQHLFYKITIKSSETLVKGKFPLQYVREQTPTNSYQMPRTRGNKEEWIWLDIVSRQDGTTTNKHSKFIRYAPGKQLEKEQTVYLLQWRHNALDGVSNHQPQHCLLSRLFGRKSEKTSKLRVTDLCAGNSSGTGELPAPMASNAEKVSIWWRHHAERD